MFLDVSGSVLGVEMNETERANFAKWLEGLQRAKFDNNAKAAYTAAGVNSGTWARALGGQPLRPQSISKIVNRFRPDAEGDWTRLGFDRDPTVGGSTQDETRDYVSSPGPRVDGGASDSAVLDAIKQMRDDMLEMEQRLADKIQLGDHALSERLDRLEGSGS